MLNQLGTLELSGRKVWFQLKGKHKETFSTDDLRRLGYVPVAGIRLDDLRFWYASPEATYLVVYLEAIDGFLAEDVRDIVEREWGADFLSPGRFGAQETVTVHISARSVLDAARLDAMLAHRSMRIDGPAFRGRPLGHRLDPLRCELDVLDPEVFERLILRLLDAHLFRDVADVDPRRVLKNVGDDGHRLVVQTGTLHTTYEYPFAGSIEHGYGPDTSEPRSEGQWFSVVGHVAVIIQSRVADPLETAEELPKVLADWDGAGVNRVLVFSNASDMDYLFPYRQAFGDRCDIPQGLSSIAYNLLTATLVYLDFQEELRWKWLNYQVG